MNYITSREYGRQPFTPDKSRGHWATVSDYLYISVAMAFKVDYSAVAWFFLFRDGIGGIILYLLNVAIFVVPILVIQSFLGQFSSSGFISALRVSPLFKAVGYTSLFFNFCVLTYYSTFAAIPLFYFLHSLRPTLPWSCDGLSEWITNSTSYTNKHICNRTAIELFKNNASDSDTFFRIQLPSVMFYTHQFNINGLLEYTAQDTRMSWQLVGCTFLIWTAIAYIFHTCRRTETFGKLLNGLTLITLSLLMLCLIRFLFLLDTNIEEIFGRYFFLDWHLVARKAFSTTVGALQIFGPGWGAMITLASFNKFKNDIREQSWLICSGQMAVLFAFIMISGLLEGHLEEDISGDDYILIQFVWGLFLGSGSALAKLSMPNLWCLLFYSMLTLCGVIVMVIQAHSFFTAIFDEFVSLRQRKTEVMFGLIGTWSVLSLYTCTVHGFMFSLAMTYDNMIIQLSFDLLILLMVLWIYGRERFQRDIEFMLGYPLATWKVYLIRFVTPLGLLLVLCETVNRTLFFHTESEYMVDTICALCLSLPWLIVPFYIGYSLKQSTGPMYSRWKKVCLPTDWYPVEREDRQRYEVTFASDGNGATQQLEEIVETSLCPQDAQGYTFQLFQ